MFTVFKCKACGVVFEKYGFAEHAVCPICECPQVEIVKRPVDIDPFDPPVCSGRYY